MESSPHENLTTAEIEQAIVRGVIANIELDTHAFYHEFMFFCQCYNIRRQVMRGNRHKSLLDAHGRL